jgi:hypothetical protein
VKKNARPQPWQRFLFLVFLHVARLCAHAVLPNGTVTGLDIGFSNASLVHITMSFYTMCKSTTPIFLLIFAFIWRLETCVTTQHALQAGMLHAGHCAVHNMNMLACHQYACTPTHAHAQAELGPRWRGVRHCGRAAAAGARGG